MTIRLGERQTMEEEAFNARLPVFAQQHPHITVQRDVITGDLTQKLQTMAASNTLPDNIHAVLSGQTYHRFAIGGALRVVEPHIARDRFDLKPYLQRLIEYMRLDGKLYGLPFKGQISRIAFFYNINLFQERGIAIPTESWTLDDLVKAAQALTRRSGSETTQWGFALNPWGSSPFDAYTMPFDEFATLAVAARVGARCHLVPRASSQPPNSMVVTVPGASVTCAARAVAPSPRRPSPRSLATAGHRT